MPLPRLDLLLVNGNIITLDRKRPYARAIAVSGGRIVFVGDTQEILPFIPASAEVVDLNGRTVIPGLIDNHCHLLQAGYAATSLDLQGRNSIEEIKESVAKAAQEIPTDTLIRGFGYDDYQFPDYKAPTRWDLDEVAPEHMVRLNRIDFHSSIVNTRFLNELDLTDGVEGIDWDERGVATGCLRSEANNAGWQFSSSLINLEGRRVALHKATQQALQAGVTTSCAMEGGDMYRDFDADFLLRHKEETPIRLEVFYQTMDVEKIAGLGLSRIGGCILVDGSFGSRTAALKKPYSDDTENCGHLYFNRGELNRFVEHAHSKRLQLSMHVIGDRAIELIISALERAVKKYPKRDHRHRIEHFELPTRYHIERAKKLGLVLSMQPSFEYFWGGLDNMYGQRLGTKRTLMTNPFNSLLKKGLTVAGGTDAAVTPLNLMLGIHSAVNHPNKKERISITQALEMFTINGAKAIFREKELGTITTGKLGDLVVLSENPYTVPTEHIKDINIDMTIVGGRIFYDRLEHFPPCQWNSREMEIS